MAYFFSKNLMSLTHYLFLGSILFAISVLEFYQSSEYDHFLMAIELMLLAVNINFIAFSSFLGDLQGQIFVFFVLTVAAAEAAIGLAILVILFRKLDTIRVDKLNKLKG